MSALLFGRKVDLIVANRAGAGLNLSGLRIVFRVTKADAQTPNTAEIRVYNVARDTVQRMQDEFEDVTLQAGYDETFGVIFRGNIKQAISGRDGVDSFVTIYAGDGDAAYNFAIVNATLAAGAGPNEQIRAALGSMAGNGVGAGYVPDLGGRRLPRGKVLYGMARDVLRQNAESTGATWSIQDGRVQFLPRTGLLPSQAVVLNSKTGLVGQPEQTTDGIKFRALLNPLLRIGARVMIDEADVARAKIDPSGKDKPANKPADVSRDGVYRLLAVEYVGDTHGQDWYADGVALDVDATAPKGKEVKST
ncbi:MAG TPA: hypothetical protein VNT52_00975 [Acidimicrobiales bacterium]|nr:hypothetical protein [Acidimicrobiales bacterium]